MAVATPEVTLIAHTVLTGNMPEDVPWEPNCDSDPDSLADFSGRACYQSFHRPNPATRENADYIANIIRQGHGSVLEHSTATFYITGVSRALTHELVRHRHLNYSQQSQRFVNESGADCVVPPALRDDPRAVKALADWQDAVNGVYENMVTDLAIGGVARKQAREAARAVLPNMTETRIVVTGNLRAWRDVLGRRLDPAADAEIREVSGMILAELKKIAPNSFADFGD